MIPSDPDDEEENYGTPKDKLTELVEENKLRIKIFGMGGAGSNTIKRMVSRSFNSPYCEITFVAANTDASHLSKIGVKEKIVLGKQLTKGRGAGADPQVGNAAARESQTEIEKSLDRVKIAIIVTGLGGGTGTGSAPFLAMKAKERNAIVISIASLPLEGEGKKRMENAKKGLGELMQFSDSTILFENDRIRKYAPRELFSVALEFADSIMMSAIEGLIESVSKSATVNTELSDLEKILELGGLGIFGVGISDSSPDQRVIEACESALNSPFNSSDIGQAKGLLLSISGDSTLTVEERERAMKYMKDKVSPGANIIVRQETDDLYRAKVKIIFFATGIIPDGFEYKGSKDRNEIS
ncbi:MAG: cell division protein FtsZ [Cuniculiplasma sp.]